MDDDKSKDLCQGCGQCCTYITIEIKKPQDKDDWDELLWFLNHENIWIFVEDGEWFVQVNNKCKHLKDDKTCGIYQRRPLVCREHNHESCEKYGYGEAYDILFKTPEDMLKYMKRENIFPDHPMFS